MVLEILAYSWQIDLDCHVDRPKQLRWANARDLE